VELLDIAICTSQKERRGLNDSIIYDRNFNIHDLESKVGRKLKAKDGRPALLTSICQSDTSAEFELTLDKVYSAAP
jgi:hypothetical protein